MKQKATTLILTLAVVGIASMPVQAQEFGDLRSRASGDWSSAGTWSMHNGSIWVNAPTAPTGDETIWIHGEDSVFVDIEINITGRLIVEEEGRLAAGEGNLTFADGGVYQHNRDDGTIPTATWAEGSVLHLTGVTAVAPANRNQSYHHIIFETPDQLSNLNMQLNDVTIGGDITVLNTGHARWYLTSAEATESSHVTLLGDVIVSGEDAYANGLSAQFSVQGTSNALTTFVVDHYGDIIVTAGNMSISRGTQGQGTTTWNMHEGSISMTGDVASQNSTATPGGAYFVFRSGGTQTLTIDTDATLSSLPIRVENGTILDLGNSVITGSGDFVVRAGSGIALAHPGGVADIFHGDRQGVDTLDVGSSYVFNGPEAQVTSEVMPTEVLDLVINNEAGVTLSQETTVNGVLRLQAGLFDNSTPVTLGPEGRVALEGGSIVDDTVVSVQMIDGMPGRFFVDQNYPNPFRARTAIRFGLAENASVSVKVFNTLGQHVATAHDGYLSAGVHELALDLGKLSSGIYFYRVETEREQTTRRMVVLK